MATELLMPKLGLTMTEGTIDEWKKKVGDTVRKGDIIYSVATDKLTNDVEAEADGVLLKILVAEGETVPCKTLVGWLRRGRPCRCPRAGGPRCRHSRRIGCARACGRLLCDRHPLCQETRQGEGLRSRTDPRHRL